MSRRRNDILSWDETQIVNEARNIAGKLSRDFSKTALRKFHTILVSCLKESNLKVSLNRARIQLAYFIGRRGKKTERELFQLLDPALEKLTRMNPEDARKNIHKVRLFVDALIAFAVYKERR